jgi:hypothetical protein
MPAGEEGGRSASDRRQQVHCRLYRKKIPMTIWSVPRKNSTDGLGGAMRDAGGEVGSFRPVDAMFKAPHKRA